jgi:hypothetical protein
MRMSKSFAFSFDVYFLWRILYARFMKMIAELLTHLRDDLRRQRFWASG